jgi:hypothetical protein
LLVRDQESMVLEFQDPDQLRDNFTKYKCWFALVGNGNVSSYKGWNTYKQCEEALDNNPMLKVVKEKLTNKGGKLLVVFGGDSYDPERADVAWVARYLKEKWKADLMAVQCAFQVLKNWRVDMSWGQKLNNEQIPEVDYVYYYQTDFVFQEAPLDSSGGDIIWSGVHPDSYGAAVPLDEGGYTPYIQPASAGQTRAQFTQETIGKVRKLDEDSGHAAWKEVNRQGVNGCGMMLVCGGGPGGQQELQFAFEEGIPAVFIPFVQQTPTNPNSYKAPRSCASSDNVRIGSFKTAAVRPEYKSASAGDPYPHSFGPAFDYWESIPFRQELNKLIFDTGPFKEPFMRKMVGDDDDWVCQKTQAFMQKYEQLEKYPGFSTLFYQNAHEYWRASYAQGLENVGFEAFSQADEEATADAADRKVLNTFFLVDDKCSSELMQGEGSAAEGDVEQRRKNAELNDTARLTNDVEKIRRLVTEGAELVSTNGPEWRHTSMHQAAFRNTPQMIKVLIELCREQNLLGRVLGMEGNDSHLLSAWNHRGGGARGTPIELARGGGHGECAALLEQAVQEGMDADAQQVAQLTGLSPTQALSLLQRHGDVEACRKWNAWREKLSQAENALEAEKAELETLITELEKSKDKAKVFVKESFVESSGQQMIELVKKWNKKNEDATDMLVWLNEQVQSPHKSPQASEADTVDQEQQQKDETQAAKQAEDTLETLNRYQQSVRAVKASKENVFQLHQQQEKLRQSRFEDSKKELICSQKMPLGSVYNCLLS